MLVSTYVYVCKFGHLFRLGDSIMLVWFQELEGMLIGGLGIRGVNNVRSFVKKLAWPALYFFKRLLSCVDWMLAV